MIVMARHTFSSILRTRIFWVILIFSIVLISVIGFFSTVAIIMSGFPGNATDQTTNMDRFDRRHHHEEEYDFWGFLTGENRPSRKEVDKMEIPIMDYGCNPEMGGGMGNMFNTPLVAAVQYFGFIGMAFFSNLAAIFIMMGLMPSELERRSIYTLLSKPLTRSDVYFGKLFGGWGAVIVFNFTLGLMLAIFMYLAGTPFKPKFLLVALVSSLSPMMFGTIALVLGTFLRTIAVGFFTMVALFFSADAGSAIVYAIGNSLLHWDKLTDFILKYLPPLTKIKVLVGGFISYNLFKGLTDLFQTMDVYKVYNKWWLNALFVAAYFIVLIFAGWGIFRKKEFN